MNDKHSARLRRWALSTLIAAAFLASARPAVADKSAVLDVRIEGSKTVTIVVRSGEVHLDGTFESRSGHSLVFAAGALVKATDSGKRSQRVDTVTLDSSGRLTIASGGDEWKVEKGWYVMQGGDGNPKDPEPQPEPQPRPNPNSFTVRDGEIVELGY